MNIREQTTIVQAVIEPNGFIPNNPVLPFLLYQGVLELSDGDRARFIMDLFNKNQWSNAWVNGIFGYHHYHSITHEVMGICSGECLLQLGGEGGETFTIQAGDVVLLPAGVAHKNLRSTPNFSCVGAYPFGLPYDINYGKEAEMEEAVNNIDELVLPRTDPVYGYGPLQAYWPGTKAAAGMPGTGNL